MVTATAALVTSTATLASAQLPSQIEIAWLGPVSCPRTADFDRELARLLGKRAREVESSEVSLRIRENESDRGGFRLTMHIEVSGGESEREIELPNCPDLRHAAAILIATALEREAAPVATKTVPERPSTPAPWPVVGRVRVGITSDYQSLPGLSAGPEMGFGVELGGLVLHLEGRYLLAREARDESSSLRADIDLFAASLGVGYAWQLGRVRLGPTIDGELGVMRGRGRGEQGSPSGTTLWAAALVGAVLEVSPLRNRAPEAQWLTLVLSGQLVVPLRAPTFSLEGEQPFYETEKVGGRVGLGAHFRFGFKSQRQGGQ